MRAQSVQLLPALALALALAAPSAAADPGPPQWLDVAPRCEGPYVRALLEPPAYNWAVTWRVAAAEFSAPTASYSVFILTPTQMAVFEQTHMRPVPPISAVFADYDLAGDSANSATLLLRSSFYLLLFSSGGNVTLSVDALLGESSSCLSAVFPVVFLAFIPACALALGVACAALYALVEAAAPLDLRSLLPARDASKRARQQRALREWDRQIESERGFRGLFPGWSPLARKVPLAPRRATLWRHYLCTHDLWWLASPEHGEVLPLGDRAVATAVNFVFQFLVVTVWSAQLQRSERVVINSSALLRSALAHSVVPVLVNLAIKSVFGLAYKVLFRWNWHSRNSPRPLRTAEWARCVVSWAVLAALFTASATALWILVGSTSCVGLLMLVVPFATQIVANNVFPGPLVPLLTYHFYLWFCLREDDEAAAVSSAACAECGECAELPGGGSAGGGVRPGALDKES
eukprot:m51a1_g6243 hypothetical protein (462) ;mRNA; f:19380-21519